MACELKAPFCVNLGAFADTTATFMPRESLPSIDTVGWSLPYSGLTAALLPDGRVLHGRNADAALHEHRSLPHSADDGLLLIPAMLSSYDSSPTQLSSTETRTIEETRVTTMMTMTQSLI